MKVKSYTVTASNDYFWQKLAVSALNRQSAARKFDTFLRSRSSKAEEKYEQTEGNKLAPDERHDRRCYVYKFDEDRVELADFVAGATVSMIGSGGNG
jgi:hypothetical protein